jgi:hypothetical protein
MFDIACDEHDACMIQRYVRVDTLISIEIRCYAYLAEKEVDVETNRMLMMIDDML